MFGRSQLSRLLEAEAAPAISLFLPTHVAGREIRQDPIRLKNLLDEAEQRLAEDGRRRSDIADLLAPAQALLDDADFWRHQSAGLALFIAPGRFDRYGVPLPLREKVVTGTRFHVKPLLPLFAGDGRFFILTITKSEVRLFEASKYRLDERFPDELPEGISEVVGRIDYEDAVHFHPAGPAAPANGAPAARFHALGESADEVRETAMQRFLQQLDAAVSRYLASEEVRLVVAADERTFGHFRDISKYRWLAPDGIVGNPAALDLDELHERAYAIVASEFRQPRDAAAERFRALRNDGGERTATDVDKVVRDAYAGRIETLFVAEDIDCWGRFEPSTMRVHRHASCRAASDDLLDVAAAGGLATGADVYVLPEAESPSRSPAAAILRY